jgi:hypothetical protein
MAAVLAYFNWYRLPQDESPPLFAIALFGLLGGTLSATLRASDTRLSSRIPEMTAGNRVTFMPILVGGASAIAIYSFLRSDLTGVFNAEVAKALEPDQPFTAYAIAFASGFSERLVRRAVEELAGKEQEDSKDKPKTP